VNENKITKERKGDRDREKCVKRFEWNEREREREGQ
jgi:hypothetical protein